MTTTPWERCAILVQSHHRVGKQSGRKKPGKLVHQGSMGKAKTAGPGRDSRADGGPRTEHVAKHSCSMLWQGRFAPTPAAMLFSREHSSMRAIK
jgi:hypothetical protein